MGIEKTVGEKNLTKEELKKVERFEYWAENNKEDYESCNSCGSFCSGGACSTGCSDSLNKGYFKRK